MITDRQKLSIKAFPHAIPERNFKKSAAVVMFSEKEETVTERDVSGRKTITIGAGPRARITKRKLILLARQAIVQAKIHRAKEIVIDFSDFLLSHLRISAYDAGSLLAENFEMANFEFIKYKTPPPRGWNFVHEISVKNVPKEGLKGLRDGQIVGQEVNGCRALSNTPGGEMTPKKLAEAAKNAVKRLGVAVRIFKKPELERMKMGGILGVAKGSDEEPRLIVLEYKKGGREKPIVLVGKGVTFDTGGLNLKPSNYIYTMHMDMSGGAAVIHALALTARLKLKRNVIGIIPAVENMPSGSSYHPGDILRSYSGKTIEVLDTDAEGRIILADGLAYAKKYGPQLVVDIATLTGAASVALGERATALFTKNEKLEREFRNLGEESGDYVWPLPLWEEYEEEIKGTFGDWANMGKTRYGGAITAAVFLYQFAKDYPWVHLDIAPRMTTIDGEFLAKGAAGAPVRLLAKLIARH